MSVTTHMHTRMNQRGVHASLVRLVLHFGEIAGECWYLDLKGLERLLAEVRSAQGEADKYLERSEKSDDAVKQAGIALRLIAPSTSKLDRAATQQLMFKLRRLERDIIKAIDKGGLAVIEKGGVQITTYALSGRHPARRQRESRHRVRRPIGYR